MRTSMKVGAIIALIASPAVAEGQAPPVCLTDAEAQALFTYAIPEALDGVSKSCDTALPATSFLKINSTQTIARFRAAAAGTWPTARKAFMKIAGDGKESELMAGMPDSALQPFVSAAFSGVVANGVKPEKCAKIDRFVAALAPLPPANVAALITALIGLTGDKEGHDFKLC
jgi:hypothetical protein